MNDNRRHLVKNVHRVFGILLNHPDGLASKDLWQKLADSQTNGNGNGHSHAPVPSFEDLSFACIGPIKAGWLQVAGNRWWLSESGRDAYRAYADPEQLMLEAGKRSKQGWLAVHFPRAYAAAEELVATAEAEARVLEPDAGRAAARVVSLTSVAQAALVEMQHRDGIAQSITWKWSISSRMNGSSSPVIGR